MCFLFYLQGPPDTQVPNPKALLDFCCTWPPTSNPTPNLVRSTFTTSQSYLFFIHLSFFLDALKDPNPTGPPNPCPECCFTFQSPSIPCISLNPLLTPPRVHGASLQSLPHEPQLLCSGTHQAKAQLWLNLKVHPYS